jgi:hypothetical protein
MPSLLAVDKNDIAILLDVYEQRRIAKEVEAEAVRKTLDELEEELKALGTKILSLKSKISPDYSKRLALPYPTSGTWNDKIKFVLEEAKRPLSTTEIVDIIKEEYQTDWERSKLMTSISATISAAMGSLYKKTENGIVLM